MAEMHGRFGGGCTGPCREMVLVARSLLINLFEFIINLLFFRRGNKFILGKLKTRDYLTVYISTVFNIYL